MLPNAADPVQASPVGPWPRGGSPTPEMGGQRCGDHSCRQRGPSCPAQDSGQLLLLRCLCVTHRALGAIRLRQSRRFLRGSPTPRRLGTALSSASPERAAVSWALPSPKRRKPRCCGKASSGGRSRETPSCSHRRGARPMRQHRGAGKEPAAGPSALSSEGLQPPGAQPLGEDAFFAPPLPALR